MGHAAGRYAPRCVRPRDRGEGARVLDRVAPRSGGGPLTPNEPPRSDVVPAPTSFGRATAALRAVSGELLAGALLLPAFAALIPAFRAAGTSTQIGFGLATGLADTLSYAAIAATVATLFGCILASAARRLPPSLAACVAFLALLPLLLPASLMGTAWIMALGRDGVLTSIAAQGGVRPPTAYDWPMPAVLAGCRAAGVPTVFVLLAWRRLQPALAIERAFHLSLTQRWRSLRVPALVGPLAAAWLLTLLLCAIDPIFPGMLLTHTYATQMLVQYNALFDPVGAAVLGLPLALLGIAAGLAAWRLTPHRRGSDPAPPQPAPARGAAIAGGLAAGVLLSLGLGVPVAALAWRTAAFPSLAAAAAGAMPELVRTFLLTLVGAAAAAAVGACLAAHGCWMRERGRWSLVPLAFTNLALPPTLLGIGCLGLAQRREFAWLRHSDAPLLFGYVARFAPLAAAILLVLWSRETGRVATAAARRLGLPPLQLALRITGPPRFRDAALVAAMICLPLLSEVEMSILLNPPGVTTLGVRLYTMIHTSPDSAVSALALVVLGATALAAGVGLLGWRGIRRGAPEGVE